MTEILRRRNKRGAWEGAMVADGRGASGTQKALFTSMETWDRTTTHQEIETFFCSESIFVTTSAFELMHYLSSQPNI